MERSKKRKNNEYFDEVTRECVNQIDKLAEVHKGEDVLTEAWATTIKLDQENYLLWRNLALPILRSYRLEGHLTGEDPCPPRFSVATDQSTATVPPGDEAGLGGQYSGIASLTPQQGITTASNSSPVLQVNPFYESRTVVDQLLLGWLYNFMTAEVAMQVMGYENYKYLWAAIQELFGLQSRAGEDYLRQVFQQTCKGAMKMPEYLRVMKTHSDNLGLTGSPVPTRALVSQVLLGLDEEFNPFVATIQGRSEISWTNMQTELLAFEKRQTNNNNQRGGSGRNRGRRRWNNNSYNRPTCQVCNRYDYC
ncbi:uncharacterized protein LOC120089143 [Benincasa hispida]|uniref:uncharacterized protein LOC120089143 n=1 Tax=Benincasa hispida TaxID=102211 RepID=UPI0018FF6A1F|nr:uncharacterized protein LOC120089143 [Benincasa hispida]